MPNLIHKKIPLHLKLLLKLFLFELVVFTIYRIVFFFCIAATSKTNYDAGLLFQSFLSGLRFDTVIISYGLALPFIILSINNLLQYRIQILNSTTYFFITTVFIYYQFIWAADIPYYQQFGNHLNKQALLWKDEAQFVLGFIFESISYWGFLILFIFLSLITIVTLRYIFKIFKLSIPNNVPQKKTIQLIQFILIGSILFLGIRGTTSKKTALHEGFSIISSNAFINNLGLNPNFTFLKSLLKSKKNDEHPIPKTINEDIAFTQDYLNIKNNSSHTIDRVVGNKDSIKSPNIVIVIMESMSIAKMGYYGYPNLTPQLHKINKQSVFFTNFFSSGIHTFNGLFSTTTGFPGIYDEQALKRYTKIVFKGLGTLLKKNGYDTYFGTTHDSQFDNMEGFFRINNFDNIISQSSMPSEKVISTLGVPDHILFSEFISQLKSKQNKKPFLGVLMTSTDHGPWIIPDDIAFKPTGKNEQENCTLYADWSIGQFMTEAKKQPWFNNTVFIFLGDHGFYLGQTYEMTLSHNHIPCIIYQPNLFKADTIDAPCYQPDIPATVMGIVGTKYTNNTFGIDILKEKHPFVVFSADDKIGCVDNQGFFYYKTMNDGHCYLRKYKDLDQTNYLKNYPLKADSLQKNMMHIFESANYFIRKDYFLYE
jgi:phosphoglycerol transferase MdoB-like AlkP superfamily enzyme